MKSILDVQLWLYNRRLSEMIANDSLSWSVMLMLLDYMFAMESY